MIGYIIVIIAAMLYLLRAWLLRRHRYNPRVVCGYCHRIVRRSSAVGKEHWRWCCAQCESEVFET